MRMVVGRIVCFVRKGVRFLHVFDRAKTIKLYRDNKVKCITFIPRGEPYEKKNEKFGKWL